MGCVSLLCGSLPLLHVQPTQSNQRPAVPAWPIHSHNNNKRLHNRSAKRTRRHRRCSLRRAINKVQLLGLAYVRTSNPIIHTYIYIYSARYVYSLCVRSSDRGEIDNDDARAVDRGRTMCGCGARARKMRWRGNTGRALIKSIYRKKETKCRRKGALLLCAPRES